MDRKLLENRLHGDTMFPVRVYTVDYLDGDVIFNLHWHPEFEILYLEEGEMTFQVGTDVYQMKEGDAYFIRSEQLHGAYPVKGRSFKFHAIVFHINLLKSFTFDLVDSEYLEVLESSFFPNAKKINTTAKNNLIIQLLKIYFEKKYGFEMEIKAYLLLILADVFRDDSQKFKQLSVSDENKLDLIKMIMKYINQHHQEKISVAILAEQLQMSEGHFTRFFKSIVHLTPIEYVNSVRINKACELLKKTNKPIVEVAMDVGFNSQSYFIRTFKKQRGCSPREFRKTEIDLW
ncbi:AraC family transcriptional regulator [Amphibacillus sediminis]|uniref:AraC family transcriptional regulator n=1 Tax=Amphibacillus sediminis TaxID=360185 RepID=UPI001FDFC0B4|nr:AraC family transcriptional regulator [Amphibacillus sediminis]